MKYILILITISILNACMPEDSPVSAFDRGDSKFNTAPLTRFYKDQVYFKLSTNQIVSVNDYLTWDLGFQSDGYHIVLNSARTMGVAIIEELSFEEVTESTEYSLRYDKPDGDLDSTAIGIWWTDEQNGKMKSKNYTYIIDRGSDERGRKTGKRKMQIIEANENSFKIRYANLDGSNEHSYSIKKDANYNFMNFSFEENGKQEQYEPKSEDWDIIFTKATELFPVEGFEVYSVTGAYINTKRVLNVQIDSNNVFEEVNSEILAEYSLTNKRDAIGWDWKQVDINTVVYTVNPNKIYLIQDGEGFIYKFRFVDFYEEVDGKLLRGYPKFEYKTL